MSLPDEPPKTIGRYRVEREIGRGMMGVVYAAHDPALGRTVALKTIHLAFGVPEEARKEFQRRFLAEARAAARLSHPGIVVVHDLGVDAPTGALYIALEHLTGSTLEARLAGGPLEWRQALRMAARMAEALHHAHSQGIVHRDIKPANIMVLDSGEPKIMDFGIAKIESSNLTTGGRILGSPSYLSPERALEQSVDHRSDLFSLGSVLYEALTGRRTFPGRDLAAMLVSVLYEHPPRPSSLVAGLPTAADEVVAGALAKDPSQRYADGQRLANDLGAVLAGRRPRFGRSWPEKEPTTISGVPAAPPRAAEDAEETQRSGTGPTLSLPPGKRVCLSVLDGPRRGEIFALERPQCLIGRTGGRANAELEIPDPEISRAHAVLECRGSLVRLRDLGSTNGTFVGAERVEERTLEPGDEFRVGRTRLLLIVTDPA